jgi:hypothetical protein
MTKREAEALFLEEHMPGIRHQENGTPDYPMRSEAWCNFTDSLCKEGLITTKQDESWHHAEVCYSPWEKKEKRKRKLRLVEAIMES